MSAVLGRYFVDDNGNNLSSSDERGVSGAKIYLVENGRVVATTTTDYKGNYKFYNVDAGQYSVQFGTTSIGSKFVKPGVGRNDYVDSEVWNVLSNGNGSTGTFYVPSNKTISNVDGGIIPNSGGGSSSLSSVSAGSGGGSGNGSIAGRYFHDKNKSLFEDGGDSGMAGATVRILQNGKVVGSTKTDSNGNYKFSGLEKGNYNVEFASVSSAYKFVKGNVGGSSKDTVDSDVWKTNSDGSGNAGNIYVNSGQSVTNVDAGVATQSYAPAPTPSTTGGGNGSIAGRYFRDNNKSNFEDGGDSGMAGATVRILQNGKVVGSTKTDSNGNYKFSGLEKGNYNVEFASVSSAYKFVKGNVGGSSKDTVDSDVWKTNSDGSGNAGNIYVNSGQSVTNVDAGVATQSYAPAPTASTTSSTGSVSGRYFSDNNNSDREDGGDTPIGGQNVYLTQGGKVVATTKTDSNGNYKFNNVADGGYVVEFAAVGGAPGFSRANVGGNDAIDSDVWKVGSNGNGIAAYADIKGGNSIANIDAGVRTKTTEAPSTVNNTTTNSNPTPVSNASDDLKVLFVGNSITYSAPGGAPNSAAGQFEKMAQAAGYDLSYNGSFIGGASLSQAWAKTGSTSAREMIKNNDYDLVILQDNHWNAGGVDTQIRNFSNLAEQYGAETLITSFWSGDWVISISGGDQWDSAVTYAYNNAATRNDTALSPLNKAYQEAHKVLTQIYGNGDNGQTAEDMLTVDAIHATELGAYLSANVTYAAAFGEKGPAPSSFLPPNVSYSDAKLMQDIAWSAVNQYGIFSDGDWLG
jgi:protocatechuate 3,4-dioxygenase beta subunit